MNESRKSPRPPSLEDLLRLKRAERPDADFWQDFEHGLRQKQLASIIEPKPWWLGLSLILRKVPAVGWGVSAGAAALFALVSVTSVSRFATGGSPALAVAANTPAPSVAAPLDGVSSAIVSPASLSPLAAETAVSRSENPLELVLAEAPAISTGYASQAVANLHTEPGLTSKPPASAPSLASNAIKPVARGETALASPEATAPVQLASVAEIPASTAEAATFHSATFFDWAEEHLDLLPQFLDIPAAARLVLDTAQLTRFPAALASIDLEEREAAENRLVSPRHARLLAAPILAENDPDKELVHARDRVVRRLSNGGEELYASVTRVGVSGDRLSLRF